MMEHRKELALIRIITMTQRRANKIGCQDVAKSLDVAAYWAGRALAEKLILEREQKPR